VATRVDSGGLILIESGGSSPNSARSPALANGAVKSYIGRHEPEILTHLELVVNTVSMEELSSSSKLQRPEPFHP